MRWKRALAAAAVWLALLAPAAGGAEAPAAPQPPSAEAILGPPAGEPLAGPRLAAETQEVAARLRCVVCQGLSVADSPAPMALRMRGQVGDLLARGYSSRQVLAYFEGSYGEFVLLEPPLRGLNWIVWGAPLAGLLAGALLVRRAVRRLGAAPAAADPPGAGDAGEGGGAAPDPYLRRARELAYGGPARRRPGGT